MPTIVIAHTVCASRDTRISYYGWCLLIQGYFSAVQNYAEKAELGIQKETWGVTRPIPIVLGNF